MHSSRFELDRNQPLHNEREIFDVGITHSICRKREISVKYTLLLSLLQSTLFFHCKMFSANTVEGGDGAGLLFICLM